MPFQQRGIDQDANRRNTHRPLIQPMAVLGSGRTIRVGLHSNATGLVAKRDSC